MRARAAVQLRFARVQPGRGIGSPATRCRSCVRSGLRAPFTLAFPWVGGVRGLWDATDSRDTPMLALARCPDRTPVPTTSSAQRPRRCAGCVAGPVAAWPMTIASGIRARAWTQAAEDAISMRGAAAWRSRC